MEEFDIARDNNKYDDKMNSKKKPEEPLPEVTMETARNYLNTMKMVGKFVGIGVLLCILGTAAMIASSVLLGDTGWAVGLVALLAFVAVGVALFIYSGLQTEQYEYMEKPFSMRTYIKQQLEAEWEAVKSSNMVMLIVGICMCIISPIPLVISSYISNEDEAIVIIGTCVMLLIVAFAVNLIIYAGCIMSGYHQVLEIGDYTPSKKRGNKAIEVAASIVWPLVTMVYLYIGFVHGLWHPGWIIFPITGVIFGAFSAIVEGVSREK